MILLKRNIPRSNLPEPKNVTVVAICRPWLSTMAEVFEGRMWWAVIYVNGVESGSNGPHKMFDAMRSVRMNWKLYEGRALDGPAERNGCIRDTNIRTAE